MSLEKAIEIAKKIDPSVGPTLDADRKTLSEAQLTKKLHDFFVIHKNAADIVLAHPGKSPAEIIAGINANMTAHVNNDFHVLTFVSCVLGKKGDLNSLAQSCARRIVLSDPRISNYFQHNPAADKIKISQTISDELESLLIKYFENLKGQKLDIEAITEELTIATTKKVAEVLNDFGKAG